MECGRTARCFAVAGHRASILKFNRFGARIRIDSYRTVNITPQMLIHSDPKWILFFDKNYCLFSSIRSSFHGRIEKSIGYLPRFYHHKNPHIEMIESGRRNTHHEAPNVSVNWIIGSDRIEKVESKTGRLVSHMDGVSRISKKCLFRKFLNISNKLPNFKQTNIQKLYEEEKLLAYDYQVGIYHILLRRS